MAASLTKSKKPMWFPTIEGAHVLHVSFTIVVTLGYNVLLPRMGFLPYESSCDILAIEPRYYDLQPLQSWEINIDQVRSLVDDNTVNFVMINPNNPKSAIYGY